MTIQTALQKARDWTPESTVDMRPTDHIRARLFQREALNADEVARDYGVSNALLGHAVQILRIMGFIFTESSGIDGKKRITMVNPEHVPSAEQYDATREPGRARKAAEKKKATAKKKTVTQKKAPEPKPETVPEPSLGFVEIYLLHRTDEGGIIVGLRNEQTAWVATISGGAPR